MDKLTFYTLNPNIKKYGDYVENFVYPKGFLFGRYLYDPNVMAKKFFEEVDAAFLIPIQDKLYEYCR